MFVIYNKWIFGLAQFQAKESTDIPDNIYEKILNETQENETQENENQDKDKDVVVDVFASFKKYGNKKNNEKIEKSINNFKYSGNINDFNDLNKDTKQEEPLELTYQQYKNMKEKNKID